MPARVSEAKFIKIHIWDPLPIYRRLPPDMQRRFTKIAEQFGVREHQIEVEKLDQIKKILG